MEETNRIEFKRELTKELDIEKEVVAFLNYREGGIIYIGVDDNGTPIGVNDIDGDMLRIKDRIRRGILPSPMGLFDVTAETIDDVRVIKIFVASGSEKPYYKAHYGLSERGCYMRVGTAAEPMTTTQIENIYSSRVRNSLKSIRSPRQNLTFRQLHIYYEGKGLYLNEQFASNLDLLTDDGSYNYVAYLLADENSNSIKVAKYAGTDREILISNKEYGYCSLLKATDRVLDKLNVENAVKSEITYKRRIDTPLWNESAMREIVINSMVHNDYYTNEVPPKFEIFSDRIEITSAGRLPIGMSEEDFFSGVSAPRNKELMRVFRDVELVEALGSGMLRIMKVYDRSNFVFMDNFIRVVIPFAWQPEPESFTKTVGKTVEKSVEKTVGKSEEKILALMMDNSYITTKQIVENIGLTRRGVEECLKNLNKSGMIRRVGGRKLGHWEVTINQ